MFYINDACSTWKIAKIGAEISAPSGYHYNIDLFYRETYNMTMFLNHIFVSGENGKHKISFIGDNNHIVDTTVWFQKMCGDVPVYVPAPVDDVRDMFGVDFDTDHGVFLCRETTSRPARVNDVLHCDGRDYTITHICQDHTLILEHKQSSVVMIKPGANHTFKELWWKECL